VSLDLDQAKYRNNHTFAHSKYESDSKKRSKRLAARMSHQGNCPNKDVDAGRSFKSFCQLSRQEKGTPHPFANWKLLQS